MSDLARDLASGYPLLRIATWEEGRALGELVEAARAVLGPGLVLSEWDSATAGEPVEAVLDRAAAAAGPALFVLRDVHPLLGDPRFARRLRRLPAAIGGRPVRVVLLTPPGDLPADLSHDLPSHAHALPGFADMVALVEREAAGRLDPTVPPRIVAAALTGLTTVGARMALNRAAAAGPIGEQALTRLFEDKARRVQGSALEFFPPTVGLDDLGGLDVFKEWVLKRAQAFRGTGGGAPPRGVLLTGVSGCGKSFAIKALSRAFQLALFRLDMSRIFARPEPEAAFTQALDALATMAPCILWIDEIENALSLGSQDTGSATRVSGSFLTWLQERPEGIVVAATANRIEQLPAELLRRGRFDQVFFVDLPDETARKRVWAVHLARRAQSPARFDLLVLARATAGWSGAEIEAAVESALIEARHQDQPLAQEHLFQAIGRTTPLSVTMKEQIKRIKEWAHERAQGAAGKP